MKADAHGVVMCFHCATIAVILDPEPRREPATSEHRKARLERAFQHLSGEFLKAVLRREQAIPINPIAIDAKRGATIAVKVFILGKAPDEQNCRVVF